MKRARRYDVLDAIRKNERASIRELCAMTGIKAESQVYMHLYQLETEGLIEIERKKARGIHLKAVSPKSDWRKAAELREGQTEKRRKAGQAGRGRNALVGKSQRALDEQERMNEVVRKARERDALGGGVDVIRENRSGWGTHGMKVG